MRLVGRLAGAAVLVLAAACGGPATNGAESDDANEPPASEPTGNGGGGGGGSADLDELLENLTPPNATQITRQTSEGFLFVIWNSTDSSESLKDFYEGRIADAGFDNVTRTESGGVYSWLFGDSDQPDFVGAVGIGPTTDGTEGANVSVQLSRDE